MEKKEPKIKIYVSCHKESYIPDNKLLYPIQVGTALAEKKLQGMLYDNEGDNISAKNKQYCELTAQYWAWKNDRDADYYGFMHYRRYFSFSPVVLKEDIYDDGNGKIRDGIVYNYINKESLKKLCFNETLMVQTIKEYDMIVPSIWHSGETMYEQYNNWDDAVIEDFDLIIEIIYKKYPKYIPYLKKYINGMEGHLYNMFIMKKDIFNEYCEWLFDILFEAEKRIDISDRNIEKSRAIAYLGERLLDIFYLYKKDNEDVKCCELQRALFLNSDVIQVMYPMQKQNNIPVILSSNNYYAPYLSVTIQSILENSTINNYYDILVLHTDISEENRRKISMQSKNYNNVSIRFINVSGFIDNYNFYIHMHFTSETYYRLLIPDLLKEYHKVIYLDCDLVVNEDIANLYKINIDGYLLAGTRDADVAGLYNRKDIPRKNYMEKELGLKKPYDYFQAGVVLFNIQEFRKKFKVQDLLEAAGSKNWEFVDQDLLNVYCQGKVKFIDMSWNVLINWMDSNWSRIRTIKYGPANVVEEYFKARINPKIVHYAGYVKPWENTECDMADFFWKYARKSIFYEVILSRIKIKNEVINVPQIQSNVEEMAQKVDNQGIRIKGIDDTIYVDGIMVKAINKFNKKYPIGSKKRDRLRKIVKKFIR